MSPRNKLSVFLFVFSTTILLAGSSFAASVEQSTAKNQSDIDNVQGMSGNSVNEVVEILPKDFRPAFTRDTVIKLNAIVKRSYSVIGELDQFRKELNMPSGDSQNAVTSSKQLSEHQLATIKSLSARSQAAHRDMNAAVGNLKASDEQYNSAVLAGMVIFVQDVEQEVEHFQQNTKGN